jgi:hypothetical protein
MSGFRLVALLAVLGLGVVLGGCGQSASEKANLAAARSVVERFAAGTDARACHLLTNNAVQALYGKFTATAAQSRRNCARRSVRFRGETVKITRSELLDPMTIKINALDQDGKFSYQVNLRKGRGGRWRIDLISQAKVTSTF